MFSIVTHGSEFTMSSLDFLNDVINPIREAFGEKPVRPSDFHAKVNDEIDEKLNYENFVVGKTGHKTYYTHLNMDQMLDVGMRESKGVRKAVRQKLKELSSPSDDDKLLMLAEGVVRLTRERDEAIKTKAEISRKREASVMGKLGAATKKIKKLEEIGRVYEELPSGYASKSKLTPAIRAKFGISQKVAGVVIQTRMKDKALMVRNEDDRAENATYLAYPIAAATDVFKKFIKECEPVSGKKFKHELIENTFIIFK